MTNTEDGIFFKLKKGSERCILRLATPIMGGNLQHVVDREFNRLHNMFDCFTERTES